MRKGGGEGRGTVCVWGGGGRGGVLCVHMKELSVSLVYDPKPAPPPYPSRPAPPPLLSPPLPPALFQVSSYEHPGLKPAAARLANSMVAVLGPEFTLGSVAYRMTRSLINDSDDSAAGWVCHSSITHHHSSVTTHMTL